GGDPERTARPAGLAPGGLFGRSKRQRGDVSRLAWHVRCLDDAQAYAGFPAPGRFLYVEKCVPVHQGPGYPIAFSGSGLSCGLPGNRRWRQQRHSITTRITDVSTVYCRIAFVGDRIIPCADERAAQPRSLVGELAPGGIRLV